MEHGCCVETEGGVGGNLWKQLFIMGKKCESWLKKKKKKLDTDDEMVVPGSLFQLLVMDLTSSVFGFFLSAVLSPHVPMAKGKEEAPSPLVLLKWNLQ